MAAAFADTNPRFACTGRLARPMHTENMHTEKKMDTDEPACPAGFITIGVFFLFGATMAAFAAITLLKPGTALDALWVLNRAGHTQLASLDKGVGLGSLVLSVLLCTASIGWFRRRDWGCRLGTTIIAINAAGDLVNLMAG